MNYESFVKTFETLKNQGVPKHEAMDVLEFDSDEYPCPKELRAAFEKVYGAEHE